ncbi:hypothetical protein PCLA_16f0040 [Pseudomonas citronellolis]|nr:hypothetical protein PCLA_16f0040 [Pseudomonas citronellolis]
MVLPSPQPSPRGRGGRPCMPMSGVHAGGFAPLSRLRERGRGRGRC